MKKVLFISVVVISLILLPAFIHASSDDNCKASCSVKSCSAKAKSEVPKAICPVCGMKIENLEKAVKLEHKGKTLFFMSEACKEAFVKEPEKYLKDCCKDKACYVCSKGCDQKANEAGKCPKCGAEMKMLDSTEKAICCQTASTCEKKK